jgi:hypothetical protein
MIFIAVKESVPRPKFFDGKILSRRRFLPHYLECLSWIRCPESFRKQSPSDVQHTTTGLPLKTVLLEENFNQISKEIADFTLQN